MNRIKSPLYPSIGLKSALRRVEKLFEKHDRKPVTPLEAVAAWGYSSLHGKAVGDLSALKKYGLLEAPGNKIVAVSELAIGILLNRRGSPEKHQEALRESALKPKIFKDVYNHCRNEWGRLPTEGVLSNYLQLERNFTRKGALKAAKAFIETFELANMSEEGYDSEGESEEEEERESVELEVGDFVQWVSQGVDRFSQPKRLTGFSGDGTIAFVEGEKAGFPRGELEEAEAPPEDPKVPDRLQHREEKLPMNSGIRQDVFTLDEGDAVFQWPKELSSASYQDLKDWLGLVLRKAARSAGIDPEGEPQGPKAPCSESDSEQGRQE